MNQLKLFYLNINYGELIMDYYVKTTGADIELPKLIGMKPMLWYNPKNAPEGKTYSLTDITLEKLIEDKKNI